jgi:hypothetical protein
MKIVDDKVSLFINLIQIIVLSHLRNVVLYFKIPWIMFLFFNYLLPYFGRVGVIWQNQIVNYGSWAQLIVAVCFRDGSSIDMCASVKILVGQVLIPRPQIFKNVFFKFLVLQNWLHYILNYALVFF